MINIVSNAATDATFSAGTLTITASAKQPPASDRRDQHRRQCSAPARPAVEHRFTPRHSLAVTTGGDTTANISDLQIDQANFGTASSIGVQVDVDKQATQADLTYSGGTLGQPTWCCKSAATNGFQVFNFGTGTTVSQIGTALNQVSDATGVTATVRRQPDLELQSTDTAPTRLSVPRP